MPSEDPALILTLIEMLQVVAIVCHMYCVNKHYKMLIRMSLLSQVSKSLQKNRY